jgi:hypothetical protein
MGVIKIDNTEQLVNGLRDEMQKIGDAVLEALADSVAADMASDYQKRVQSLHYPIRNPETKEPIESMPPTEIAGKLEKKVTENSAQVYIPPSGPADVSARMQELYGGSPWMKIRSKMQDLSYVNQVLASNGLKGIKAKGR